MGMLPLPLRAGKRPTRMTGWMRMVKSRQRGHLIGSESQSWMVWSWSNGTPCLYRYTCTCQLTLKCSSLPESFRIQEDTKAHWIFSSKHTLPAFSRTISKGKDARGCINYVSALREINNLQPPQSKLETMALPRKPCAGSLSTFRRQTFTGSTTPFSSGHHSRESVIMPAHLSRNSLAASLDCTVMIQTCSWPRATVPC